MPSAGNALLINLRFCVQVGTQRIMVCKFPGEQPCRGSQHLGFVKRREFGQFAVGIVPEFLTFLLYEGALAVALAADRNLFAQRHGHRTAHLPQPFPPPAWEPPHSSPRQHRWRLQQRTISRRSRPGHRPGAS